jgi:hypothetical protein
MLIKVIKPYTAQYPDPISFEAGATVHVEHDDPEWPGWFWCRVASGKVGWVHRSFLETCSGATAALRAYSARELTVVGREQGVAIYQLDGWVYIRLDTGIEGWLPQDNVQIFPP